MFNNALEGEKRLESRREVPHRTKAVVGRRHRAIGRSSAFVRVCMRARPWLLLVLLLLRHARIPCMRSKRWLHAIWVRMILCG